MTILDLEWIQTDKWVRKNNNLKFTLEISIVQYKLGRQVSEVTDFKMQGLCYDIL